jgi:hypothetical protein
MNIFGTFFEKFRTFADGRRRTTGYRRSEIKAFRPEASFLETEVA